MISYSTLAIAIIGFLYFGVNLFMIYFTIEEIIKQEKKNKDAWVKTPIQSTFIVVWVYVPILLFMVAFGVFMALYTKSQKKK